MRVPDLDWPADLFDDTGPHLHLVEPPPQPDEPLWAIMQRRWMRGTLQPAQQLAA